MDLAFIYMLMVLDMVIKISVAVGGFVGMIWGLTLIG